MSRGGWCIGPVGARLKCAHCRFADCDHECHRSENPAQPKGSERFGAVESGTQSGPESALTDRGQADQHLQESDRRV